MNRIIDNKVLRFRRNQLLAWLLVFCSSAIISGQDYGLQFNAHEYSLDERTGLNLTPGKSLKCDGNLDLEFFFRLDPNHEYGSYFGYVFRLLVGDNNIDLIHGIVPDNPNNFELVLGDKISNVVFNVPYETLVNEWVKLRLNLDFKNQIARFYVDDRVFEDDLLGFDYKKGIRLAFGMHSMDNLESKEVPAMIIRDVDLTCSNQDSYLWPLNETKGSIARSLPKGNDGIATNPNWLLRHFNTWNSVLSMDIQGEVQTAFDKVKDDLYIVSRDSLYIFSLIDHSLVRMAQSSPAPVIKTSDLIYDTISKSLLRYSLDNNYLSVLDFKQLRWSHQIENKLLTTYWHHNSFVSSDGLITALGGYGQYMYKNFLFQWNPENARFDTIAYEGNFSPRYLAGLGYNPSDSLYYIIGGYGSKSGKQSESPDYYYEMLSFSQTDRTFSKVMEFKDFQMGFCFANSVVFDNSDNLYALYFPKYQYENKLQLIQISLGKPGIVELGNPIEYKFLDVDSYADLHFSKQINSLVALSTHFTGKTTRVKVHTIHFPPQQYVSEVPESIKIKSLLWLYILGAILLIASIIVFYNRKRKSQIPTKQPFRRRILQKRKVNSIILFGGFQVFDKNGKDITALFSPLQKKLFLFIMLHSLTNNKGVSSNTMYETFWFDKSIDSARNNRAVNIAKLKSVLENVESTFISKETGYWKFDFDPSKVNIDYFEYLQIVNSEEVPDSKDIVNLLSIIENKPLLYNTNADWLDPFKSDVSNEIIDTLLKYIQSSNDDPEFLLNLVNCIFIHDSVSEEALKIKCRLLIKQGKHSLAKKAYSGFVSEYKVLYNEEYNLSFTEMLKET